MDTQLPESKFAYAFDPHTREFNGPVKVYLSSQDGTYSLPENTVECVPGDDAGLFKTFRLLPSMEGWEPVPDYRRVMLYDTATAQPVPNRLALGEELPDTVTTTQPIAFSPFDYKRNQWDANARTWRAIPDYAGHPLWDKGTGERAVPLLPGQPLPITLTTVAPPSGSEGSVRWDAPTKQWVALPVEAPEPGPEET